MKRNNTAEKAILDAEQIVKALKEGTDKSIQSIINEAVSKVVKESVEDDDMDDNTEDGFDVEDVKTEETPEVDDTLGSEEGAEDAETEDVAADAEADDETDDAEDWSDMEKYKVGDDDYDVTGADGDEVLKVFNKLSDDDQIFVKKEDDGTYSFEDGGNEYVIELDPDGVDADANAEEDDDFEVDFGGEEPSDDDEEIEIDLGGDDDEDEDALNEDLGYTDSYQKDVFAKKFNMKEPANKAATYGMDGGAPEGAEKPWAGKGDNKPFEKNVNEEVDECNLEENGGTISSIDAKHQKKGQLKQHRPNAPEYAVRKQDSPLTEAKIRKIVEAAKQIQAENKQYKEYIERIREALKESAALCINESRIIKLFIDEATTKDEKLRILERFNGVKTIKEGQNLYNTIKGELNETKSATPIVERQFVANSTKALNETTFYATKENTPALDLMSRMDNLYKK